MAMSLHDHHRRIEDIEMALVALIQAVSGPGEAHGPALREAAGRLRSRGAAGAAALLEGDALAAPYRR